MRRRQSLRISRKLEKQWNRLRRRARCAAGKETVGDLDLLVHDGETGIRRKKHVDALAEHILKFPGIDQTLAHGENKVSFTLQDGLQVDVRMLEKENFGAALLYFTGSKEHNVALRGRANDMGWTLNEYAVGNVEGGKDMSREGLRRRFTGS